MCNPVSTLYPGRLLAKGVHLGYEWEVTYNHHGFRCGYIRLSPGHPWHGKDYHDLCVEVHGGGLTFAESDYHCDKGGPDDAWWIGFDCGHAFDAPDPELLPDDERSRTWIESFRGMDRGIAGYPRTTIKTTRYVQTECESLCEQAAKAATGKVS